MVGALLPDLIDAPFGGARLAHSLSFSVGLLAVVMLVTNGLVGFTRGYYRIGYQPNFQAADIALYRAKRNGPGNAELAVPSTRHAA